MEVNIVECLEGYEEKERVRHKLNQNRWFELCPLLQRYLAYKI